MSFYLWRLERMNARNYSPSHVYTLDRGAGESHNKSLRFFKGDYKSAIELKYEYLKKEDTRTKTDTRPSCLYDGRTCSSQDNLMDCGVVLCTIARAVCGGRATRKLQATDGERTMRQLYQTKLLVSLPAAGERQNSLMSCRKKMTAKPPEGATGTFAEGMGVYALELARMSPVDDGDVLSLPLGLSMAKSIGVIPASEEEEWIQVPLRQKTVYPRKRRQLSKTTSVLGHRRGHTPILGTNKWKRVNVRKCGLSIFPKKVQLTGAPMWLLQCPQTDKNMFLHMTNNFITDDYWSFMQTIL
ncbi:hypothetical protein J6590_073774 [Homalodisca vitripennis]|nr:hypothetical protein J6590_073774 [Homalodisca vitripennis]